MPRSARLQDAPQLRSWLSLGNGGHGAGTLLNGVVGRVRGHQTTGGLGFIGFIGFIGFMIWGSGFRAPPSGFRV